MKIRKNIPLLIWVIFLLFPLFSSGQGVPAMINYTVDEGLPSSETHDVIQDSKGYIWIATDRGVSRYNGYEFENFTTKDGLSDNTVFEIREDTKGRIWFLTLSLKLCYFENETFHPYEHNDLIFKTIDSLNIITSFVHDNFHIDNNGSIFLVIRGSGFIQITQKGKIIYPTAINEQDNELHFTDAIPYLYTFHTNFTDSIKVYYNNRFLCTIQKYNGLISKQFIIPQDSGRATNERLFSIFDHLFPFPSHDTSSHLYPLLNKYSWNQRIHCITKVHNEYWVGTHNGIFILDEENKLKRHFLDDQSISEIYVDQNQGIWMTSLYNGTFYIPNNAIVHYKNDTTSKNIITAIEVTPNKLLYIGYQNGNISILDKKLSLLNVFKSSRRGRIITQFTYDPYIKATWVVAIKTPLLLLKGKKLITLPALNDSVYTAISTAGKGKLFSYGYHRFISINYTIDHNYNVSSLQRELISRGINKKFQRIAPVYQDNSHVWLGGLYGLSMASDPYNQIETLSYLGDSVPNLNNRITCIAEKDSILWLGTRGNGIILFDKKSTTSFIDQNIGFIPRNINDIFVNDDNVWVASNSGVTLITENSSRQYTFQQINTSSGLSTNEVTCLDMMGDTLLIGTKKGLNILNTKTFQLNDNKNPPIFTAINVGGDPATDTNNIEITYDKNSIDFSYLTFAYGTGQDIVYQYKIAELDEEWFTTRDRTARFVALPSGNYTFKVRTLKNDSNWTKASVIHFSVLPAIWQTWYFWVTIGVVFVIVVSSIAYSSIKNANERNEMNARIEALKQSSLSSQMNPHFVFNVLNSILTFLLTNSQRNAAKYLSSFAWLMRKTFHLSRESKVSLEEEIDVLTAYFKLEKLRIDEKVEFRLEIDSDLDVETIKVPPLILQPFVENAILHGISQDKKSIISVNLTKEEGYMKVVIKDNGIGIEKSIKEKEKHPHSKSHKSSGLDISKERVALLHKVKNEKALVEIVDLSSFESANKTGTRVTFYLPLTED